MRQTTKAIDGYRIQPALPLSFPYFGATIIEADFTSYDGTTCVEAVVKLGLVKSPYTLVLTSGRHHRTPSDPRPRGTPRT